MLGNWCCLTGLPGGVTCVADFVEIETQTFGGTKTERRCVDCENNEMSAVSSCPRAVPGISRRVIPIGLNIGICRREMLAGPTTNSWTSTDGTNPVVIGWHKSGVKNNEEQIQSIRNVVEATKKLMESQGFGYMLSHG